MPNSVKKRSRKTGLPPGSLVYIGNQKDKKIKISIIDFDEATFEEKSSVSVEECHLFKDRPTITWINVDGVHDTSILEKLGAAFGLHPLVQEDIVNTDQRPKIEDYGDYLYIVLKMLSCDGKTLTFVSEQVSIILGKNFVISFQEEGKEGDVFGTVREKIRSGKTRLRKSGADYLAYSLIDAIVDNYFSIMEKLGERIEVLEEDLVANPKHGILKSIQKMKKEMLHLRKSVWPLREVINIMYRGDSALINDQTRMYLRDVYDHTIQVIETIETFRDTMSSMLDIYLSSISNKLNEVMKVLTIIATIFIPLTFIVGIYGMNFKYMPELEWRYGYLFIWIIMCLVVVSMIRYFRGKKWF